MFVTFTRARAQSLYCTISSGYHMRDKMYFFLNIYAMEIFREIVIISGSGAVSWRGICFIWFRVRQISPSIQYREASSVAESSEGPTASKSDRSGQNPGMTRLVRRCSATS